MNALQSISRGAMSSWAKQYNAAFAELVALETQKRGLHELSISSL